MRLKRDVLVAGLDPEVARTVARICHAGWTTIEGIAHRSHLSIPLACAATERLTEAEFLELGEIGGDCVWRTTLAGGGLANASFLKPMSRDKAESLLDGAISRAKAFNADPTRLFWIDELQVFGSYLNREAPDYGDLDLNLVTSVRPLDEEWGTALHRYARESGRRLQTIQEIVLWPYREVRQVVRGRSPYISVTSEDLSQLPTRWEVVYRRG